MNGDAWSSTDGRIPGVLSALFIWFAGMGRGERFCPRLLIGKEKKMGMILYLLAILFVAGLYFGIILILGKKEIEGAMVCILCLAGFLMTVIAGSNSLRVNAGTETIVVINE